MYQPYTSSSRLRQSLKLATIHTIAGLGYALVFLFIMLSLADTDSWVTLILMLTLLPLIIIVTMLAAYIYTTSYSRHFACRIGYIQAIQLSISIGFQLFLYGLLALVLTIFIFYISADLGLILFIIEYLLFPLTVFYFVQEWVLENRGNTILSKRPNPNYIGFAGPMMSPPPQYGKPQVMQPQYVQQEYRSPSQQPQQQPPNYNIMDQQPAKEVQSEPDESQTEQKPSSTLNFCSHCGNKVDDSDVQYCGSCGRPVNT